jgi:hypothetical protein
MRTSLHRALSRVAAAAGGRRFLIPRLATRELFEALPAVESVERPAVSGRTVWGDTAGAVAVVDQPNRLGYLEAIPPAAVVVRNVAGTPIAAGATVIHDVGRADDDVGGGFARRTTLARRLAGAICQVRGVRTIGTVESPRCTLLVPSDPVGVCAALDPALGISAIPLGSALPEYPGGIVLEIGTATTEIEAAAYAGAATRYLSNRSA